MLKCRLWSKLLSRLLRYFGIYKLYERWLHDQVESDVLPEHIAIILDGNRRWAAGRALPSISGHEKGAETGEKFLEWVLDLNIKTITIYAFSTENLRRKKEEVNNYLQKLYRSEQIKKVKKKIKDAKSLLKNIKKLSYLF